MRDQLVVGFQLDVVGYRPRPGRSRSGMDSGMRDTSEDGRKAAENDGALNGEDGGMELGDCSDDEFVAQGEQEHVKLFDDPARYGHGDEEPYISMIGRSAGKEKNEALRGGTLPAQDVVVDGHHWDGR